MIEPTHTGVRVQLSSGGDDRSRERVAGVMLFALASVAVVLFAVLGEVCMALAALQVVFVAMGVVAWSRWPRPALEIGQHDLRIRGAVGTRTVIPLHEVVEVQVREEMLVLETSRGDVELWLQGRSLDKVAEVAALIEVQRRKRVEDGDPTAVPSTLGALRAPE